MPEQLDLARALDYVSELGREEIALREKMLLDYATERLSGI